MWRLRRVGHHTRKCRPTRRPHRGHLPARHRLLRLRLRRLHIPGTKTFWYGSRYSHTKPIGIPELCAVFCVAIGQRMKANGVFQRALQQNLSCWFWCGSRCFHTKSCCAIGNTRVVPFRGVALCVKANDNILQRALQWNFRRCLDVMSLYRWVPFKPNTLNPNSQFTRKSH